MVDETQIDNTEKVIYELSNLLQQFNTKMQEQENVSLVCKWITTITLGSARAGG